jgi:hypothetical protein
MSLESLVFNFYKIMLSPNFMEFKAYVYMKSLKISEAMNITCFCLINFLVMNDIFFKLCTGQTNKDVHLSNIERDYANHYTTNVA